MKTASSFIVGIAAVLFMGLITFYIGLWLFGVWHDEWSGYNSNFIVSDGVCNIAIVDLKGEIMTLPDPEYVNANPHDFRWNMSIAEGDENVAAILVEVDSPGGYPAASEALAETIQNAGLPVIAYIGDYGTSGAYLAASAANTIVASPFSDVGGIGVTMSYLENIKQNENDGLTYVPLASAPFKDYGNPNKPLTDEERALLERDLAVWHEEFVEQVAENRGMSLEDVKRLADGASLPGKLAFEQGLVDGVGSRNAVKPFFAEMLGISEEEVVFCE